MERKLRNDIEFSEWYEWAMIELQRFEINYLVVAMAMGLEGENVPIFFPDSFYEQGEKQ